jgi:hypothetical protein
MLNLELEIQKKIESQRAVMIAQEESELNKHSHVLLNNGNVFEKCIGGDFVIVQTSQGIFIKIDGT